MPHIAIISSSVRMGRKSHRVALFIKQYILDNQIGTAEILDLLEYNFPIFEERLSNLKEPSSGILDFAERITSADGVIVVTPEYNGGYPASLKNVMDLLYPEWKRKVIGISTASNGSFGGSQVGPPLAFSFLKIGALVTPAVFRVPTVHKEYNEDGSAVDPEASARRAKVFFDEFTWLMEAKAGMNK